MTVPYGTPFARLLVSTPTTAIVWSGLTKISIGQTAPDRFRPQVTCTNPDRPNDLSRVPSRLKRVTVLNRSTGVWSGSSDPSSPSSYTAVNTFPSLCTARLVAKSSVFREIVVGIGTDPFFPKLVSTCGTAADELAEVPSEIAKSNKGTSNRCMLPMNTNRLSVIWW
jgi:hypothetical protein